MSLDEQRYLKKTIKILKETDQYIVFDKPAGLLVIATPRKEANTLLNIVNHQYRNNNTQGRLYPCHRLDRDTSGAIIFSKDKRHQKIMMDIFKNKKIKKKYIAFVQGKMSKKEGEFKSRIRHLEQSRFKANSPAKSAVTAFRVIQENKDFSVVEIYPLTGRTNQIRIHFSEAGHPLLGERKYAIARNCPLKFRRTALHAASLQWIDPDDRKEITVQSNLPNDMEVFLARSAN